MARVEETIDVRVPVRVAYDQWTQFEEFPRFMEGVERVVQRDDATLEWTARVAGQRKSWTARIVDQTPDRRVAWESTTGARNAGAVTFEPLDEARTRVRVEIEAEPEGPAETAGAALGLLERQVREDLERFRAFIEARGRETGAWRGEIRSGRVTTDDEGGPESSTPPFS